MGGEHVELSLQPGRDGFRATLLTPSGEEQPLPVAPKDALGFLAAVFQQVPRGVVKAAGGRARRLLLSVRPAARPNEYRVRVTGAVESAPPATLADVGFSPSVLELLLETLERRAGILLVSGGPATGRTTTLDLMAQTLVSRGHAGGRIGPRARKARPELPWLAGGLSEWPFPDSLLQAAPEFVLVESLEGAADLVLAARLAASGCLVLAGAPAADPEALSKSVVRALESARHRPFRWRSWRRRSSGPSAKAASAGRCSRPTRRAVSASIVVTWNRWTVAAGFPWQRARAAATAPAPARPA